jgi:hypothetical protein
MQSTSFVSKTLRLASTAALVIAGFTLALQAVHAGGNFSQHESYLQLQKISTPKEFDALKEGDLVVRSCPGCHAVTLHPVTKGNYKLLDAKCESCSKPGIFTAATSKAAFPKEAVKR